MSFPINELPDSIILRIFSILGTQRVYNLFRLRLVCRKWKAFAEDSDLWRTIAFPSELFFYLEDLEIIISWCDNVIEVDISSSLLDQQNSEWLNMVSTKCPNLEVLKAKNCPQINAESFKKFTGSCSRLKKIMITIPKDVTSEHFTEMIKNCPLLEDLEIDTGEGVEFVLSDTFVLALLSSNIRRFACNSANLVSSAPSPLVEIPIPPAKRGGRFQARCRPTNQHMMLTNCPTSKLEELHIPNCRELTDDNLYFLASKCPNLKSLNIKYCRNVSEVGISSLSRFCPFLEILHATLHAISTHAIEALGVQAKNLKTLGFGSPHRNIHGQYITLNTLKSIAAKCPNLMHLDLASCHATDEGIIAIARSCKNLRSLNVGFSRLTTDCIITGCSRQLHKLTEFGGIL